MPATAAGRQLGLVLRDKLASDPGWRTFTADQRKWICSWCLAAVQRRHQRSWEDSIGAHLEGCKHYGMGRFAPQPPASIAAQLSFENMIARVDADQAWQIFDSGGCWICPSCLERVPDARMVAGSRTTLTYRGMALHLQRCAAYGTGAINAAPVVRAAKDRPAGSRTASTAGVPARLTVPTPQHMPVVPTPVATPSPMAQQRSDPAIPMAQQRSDPAIPVATPVRGAPVATPVATPVAVPSGQRATPSSGMRAVTPAVQQAQLRTRRFITPSGGTVPALPPGPPPAVPPEHVHLDWMDAADAAAGLVEAVAGPQERTDLQRARDLQQNLLGAAPELDGYRFATRYEPCDHVSGDFFTFVRLLDGRLGFAIGDVSGHGMQAGLVMSMAKKTLEIYGELIGDPAEVLAKVNDALAGDLGGKMFVSMTYGILAPLDRTIRWARAGHNPTLVLSRSTGEVNEIRPPGMVVGMKAGQVFRDSLQVETTRLDPGDVFLLYTDGVTEMTNAQGEEFDDSRLREIMIRHADEGPEALLTHVMDRIRHFRGSKPVADDVTLLALAVS